MGPMGMMGPVEIPNIDSSLVITPVNNVSQCDQQFTYDPR